MAHSLAIQVLSSIGDIDARDWDRLVAASETGADGGARRQGNPFMSHAFLSALEDSNSACRRTGWGPSHLVLSDAGGEILGALPCYLKSHSQGEYVFDHGWADAFERAGGQYYPKLQCCVPFTPATGSRLLTTPGQQQSRHHHALLDGLTQLSERLDVSSAHITFMPEQEWNAAGEAGYLLRTDQQFHWRNNGYAGFEDFLSALASRKRKNIRNEPDEEAMKRRLGELAAEGRRKERETALARNGVEIVRLTGDDLTEAVWDRFFEFYMDTGSRKWGRPYLTREFYSLIGERMADRIVLIMARRAGRYIAGAINFLGDDCLYGRHWGCVEEHACLHFEVCYYQAIDYAIEHGLSTVEAGAQGEHKLARGYVPVITRSAHRITHPGLRRAVQDYLEHERRHVEDARTILMEHAPFRKSDQG